jgi:hypothetical protein
MKVYCLDVKPPADDLSRESYLDFLRFYKIVAPEGSEGDGLCFVSRRYLEKERLEKRFGIDITFFDSIDLN